MRKIQLVEMGIIAAVLVLGYNMITSLLALITSLLFGMGSGISQNIMSMFLPMVLYFAFYTITFFLLARNVTRLARFICREGDAPIDFKIDKVSVLYVIIIAICLGSFLQTIPDVLGYIIEESSARPGTDLEFYNRGMRMNLWNSLIGLILSIILLLTAKKIALFFGKDEQSFEIDGAKPQDNT